MRPCFSCILFKRMSKSANNKDGCSFVKIHILLIKHFFISFFYSSLPNVPRHMELPVGSEVQNMA